MTNQHTLKSFDTDLEHIRSGVLAMAGLVEQQVTMAMQGLASGDLALLEEIIKTDQRVNRYEVDLDESCTRLIALRQPAAVDLRMVMTVIRTITDLERVGDEAKKIAKMARSIHTADSGLLPRLDLHYLADMAVSMLRMSLDAFARLDLSASAQVVRQDQQVDAGFKGAMRQLITFMMEDPRTITRSLELLFIAKSIERIGDHAKNISEYVVYLAKGRDVRHIGTEATIAAIEQEATTTPR